jgi:predicted RNA binding protein YcfA (HicA-like mRNA interferase family)
LCSSADGDWRVFNGAHHIFTLAGRRERLVIPIHGNTPLKIGLLCSLMKIAELDEADL